MVSVAQLKTDAQMIPYRAQTVPPGRIRILVEGKFPLLSHNPASMHNPPQTKKGGNIPLPEDKAEAGAYRLEDGTCATKGEGFRLALLATSTDYKVPKKRYSFHWILEHVRVVEDLIALKSTLFWSETSLSPAPDRERVEKWHVAGHASIPR